MLDRYLKLHRVSPHLSLLSLATSSLLFCLFLPLVCCLSICCPDLLLPSTSPPTYVAIVVFVLRLWSLGNTPTHFCKHGNVVLCVVELLFQVASFIRLLHMVNFLIYYHMKNYLCVGFFGYLHVKITNWSIIYKWKKS